jgi:hypothetical protein
VVALVDDDQVERVRLEPLEPALGSLGQLVDVGHHDVRVVAVVQVGVRVEHRPIWTGSEIGKDASAAVETARIRDVEVSSELVPDRQVRSDDESSPSGQTEGRIAIRPLFPHPTGI